MLNVNKLWNGLDHLVSRMASPRMFFSDGLGDQDFLRSLPVTSQVSSARVTIESEQKGPGFVRRLASFSSPASWLPEESKTAYIEMTLPESGAGHPGKDIPIFIHFAATGDESTLPRRMLLAEPLARKGIASVILENPYYGRRRPADQKDFVIETVSDQFKMNQATILEGLSLLKWLNELGYTNLGVTGVSMGGAMAASVAASSELAVSVAACIAPVGPGPAFCYGALSNRVDWQRLAPELAQFFGGVISEQVSFIDQDVPANTSIAKRRLYRLMSVADLRNYAAPRDPSRAILVGAHQDGYVPYRSVRALHEHWKGSLLRTVPGGHVSAVLLKGNVFRDAIEELAFSSCAKVASGQK
ncbi:MAG: alpha/beta hydrolase family protein [Leptospiraceae bacterium]